MATATDVFVMPNRFEKACTACDRPVPEGQGWAAKENGYWQTYCDQHLPHPRPLSAEQRQKKHAEDAERELRWEIDDSLLLDPETHRASNGFMAFPYQRDGAAWLRRRRRALLADDMGLGKTVQALLALPKDARVLLVVPASVKGNWRNECLRWRPDLTPRVLSGTKGGADRFVPGPGEVVICNYDILPAESKAPRLPSGTVVVLDEAQAIKNYKSLRHKRIKRLLEPADVRAWLLTGTPMLNRPPDLYSLLQAGGMDGPVFGHFGRFCGLCGGSKGRFGMEWSGVIDPKVPALLRRAMLRRMKTEVLKDLPPKRFMDLTLDDIEPDLKRQLDADWVEFQAYLKKNPNAELPPFDQFSGTRAKVAEAKLILATEWIEDYLASQDGAGEPKPLVVMSAHKKPVFEIAEKFGFATITGETPNEKRTEIVERFQAGKLAGVACTIQAAGVGLTLTRADTMLFVDLDWTPANNRQAEDRINRIGQDSPCLYVSIVAEHVLERHIHRLLASKAEEQHAAIDGPIVDIPVATGEEIKAESDEEFLARLQAYEQAMEEKAAREAARLAAEEEARKETEAEAERQRISRAKEHATKIKDREAEKARAKGTKVPRMSKARAEATREAVQFLASVCDGAMTKDDQGFNKSDTAIGHILARAGLEDGSDALRAAHLVCMRYPRQVRDRWPILFGEDE